MHSQIATTLRALEAALDEARDSIDEVLVWGAVGLDRNPLSMVADALETDATPWQRLEAAELLEPLLHRIGEALAGGWSADWQDDEAARIHGLLQESLGWCAQVRHGADGA